MKKDLQFNSEIWANSLQTIKLTKGSKIPIKNAYDRIKNADISTIDKTYFNIGVLCGSINDIIVLDVDEKDNGMKYFYEHYLSSNKLHTLTVSTPNKGVHYYFTYNHSDKMANELIHQLTNKSKYLGVGLDIRTNGGYIVAPNCTLQGGKIYKVINEVKPVEMPLNLRAALFSGFFKKKFYF